MGVLTSINGVPFFVADEVAAELRRLDARVENLSDELHRAYAMLEKTDGEKIALRAELKGAYDLLHKTEDEKMALRAELAAVRRDAERMREALQWIGKRCPEQFLKDTPHRIHFEAAYDAGACARAAMEAQQ